MKKTLLLCLLLLTAFIVYAQDRIQEVLQYHNESFTYYTRMPTGQISERAQRFTTTANVNLLQAARMYWGYPIGTYTSITVKVYSATADAYPMPNVLLGQLDVPYASITNYAVTGTYNLVDLSSLNISFRSGEEFFIAYTVNGGTYAAASPWSTVNGAGILATGNVGSNRAVRYRRATLDLPYTWQTEINQWNLGISAVVDYEILHDVVLDEVNFYGTYTLPANTDMVYDATVANNTTNTETNVPVVLNVFNSANTIVFTDTQVIPSLSDVPANVVFNPFNYPVEGLYKAEIKTMLTTDQIPSNDSYMFEQQAIENYPATITYDDGTCEGAWVLTNLIGSGFVSYFTPPILPYKVSDIRYFLYGATWPTPGGTEFRAVVFDDNGPGGVPGTILYDQVVNGVRGQLNTYDTSGSNIVLQDGSFWVGFMFTQIGTNSPGLGTDSNPPFADENVTYQWVVTPDSSDLYLSGITGEDFMINATVAYPEPRNVTIANAPGGTLVGWDAIPNVGSYTVKSGITPGAINTQEAITANNSWLDPAPIGAKKFYNVKATSEVSRGGVGGNRTPVRAAPAITNNAVTLRYYQEAAF